MKINAAPALLLCFSTIALFSCTKNVDDVPKHTDVYVAGYDNGNVVYWRNGVETVLAPADLGSGEAYGMAISGRDVYIAGQLNLNAVYWKNGELVPLYTETNGFKYARAIAVNGGDVYVTGTDVFNSTGNNGFLWKNGVNTLLVATDSMVTRMYGTGIALAGGDVYICGNSGGTAMYWKNGVEHVVLNPTTQNTGNSAEATGIAVSGTDVYVSGREGFEGVYWKNGVKTVLTPSQGGIANAIMVSGSDVYVVGVKDNQAAMWKNNELTILDPSYGATATGIATNGKDIFISGKVATADTTKCVYWQNGVKKELAKVTNYPLQIANAFAIGVVTY